MQKYRKQLIELTQALVNIPTENNPPNGYEKAGQEFMSSLYADMGLNVEMFSPCDLAEYETHEGFLRERNMKDRKDVVGVWKGKGNGKSIVLSGHMDVAPKEPLAWTQCQPYDSIVKNGRVYGRGSCDMKGGLVCSAVALRMLKDEGFVPSGDIIIESVVDEEYASGNGTLASRLKGYNADFAIVCEPTGERVCAANVGSILLNIRISGSAGMPYTGEKILNVAYALGDLLKIIEVLEEKRENDTAPPLWENAVQKRKFVITKVSA
ncbi:MAG: M20/M25/M40 family metallo-hydrolase, partial [Christensenellaceae bacterium]